MPDIKFQQPYTPPVGSSADIKFGLDGEGGDAEVSGVIALGVPLLSATVIAPIAVSGVIVLGTPTGNTRINYDNAVDRGPSNAASAPWQRGTVRAKALQATSQSGQLLHAPVALAHGAGQPTVRALSSGHRTGTPAGVEAAAPWETGARVATSSLAPHREMLRRNLNRTLRSQEAASASQAVGTRHQDGRLITQTRLVSWDGAAQLVESLTTRFRPLGRRSAGVWQTPWGTAAWPAPGRSQTTPTDPPVPPQPTPCYVAPGGLNVQVVFGESWDGSTNLIFRCAGHGPGSTVIVPIREVYMTFNELQLTRVSDGQPLPCLTMSLRVSQDDWTWSFSATVDRRAEPLLAAVVHGEPVELEASINGVPYRVLAEELERDRSFPTTRINITGRGLAAVLDEPYAPALALTQPFDRTAQQLMNDVLQLNGVGIGWTVDWQITDWLVPAGAWAYQGRYIGALTQIAGAAGAYLQPHRTARTLRVLPSYPAVPWEWSSGLTPDFELPAAVVTREGIRTVRKPNYNRVFVSGQSVGVNGQVTRYGTAGDNLAPMVSDALITHADAARQRGAAILSDTGAQIRINLRMPVLEETGVILPGSVVRYVDAGVTRLGLVRSTDVDWNRPTLRQTLGVQSYVV